MQELYDTHIDYISNLHGTFRRKLLDQAPWDERLLAIKGARGVGKSTLILQHISERFGTSSKALYVSMDDMILRGHSILAIAEHHTNRGGTHLYIDEIHKYPNWSQELKNIYDRLKKLSVVVTSSSMLQLYKSNSDLSRRMISVEMRGLSFREYLQIEQGLQLDVLGLKEILSDHVDISLALTEKVNILDHFSDYQRYGYYPFYLESKDTYHTKLINITNLILDVDLPYVLGVNVHNIFKIKKLLSHLAREVPFQPNVTKLAGSLELTRGTLNQYIHYLQQADLLSLLTDAGKSYSSISKPEKIYLQNPNLSYAIAPDNVNKGNLRETFFFNQVGHKHDVHYSKQGDFLIDETYTFEIGGQSKNKKQVWDTPDSYIAADNILHGSHNKIPIWLFGFLY